MSSASDIRPFEQVGRLPTPADNAAIATQTLPAGTRFIFEGATLTLNHTVLEGHRFAVRPIATGESLLSWGQVFGVAITPIHAGDYVCNADVLAELNRRALDIPLPTQPNFQNDLDDYRFDAATFQPADPLPPPDTPTPTFDGYPRTGGRGVGTRNMIVLLATNALATGFVERLEAHLQPYAAQYPHFDGIVAATHTEGGRDHANNQDLVLRTLAGFMVNPNVGAVLVIDYGEGIINQTALQAYLDAHDYPLAHVLHDFMPLSHNHLQDITTATAIITRWLPTVAAMQRTPTPISALKIGLQCGGSDAFSGISGNPLAGWLTKAIVQHGGAANLAETDELIGAERYILSKMRNLETAERFLGMIERFKARVGWHGHSAEGNPSGGNKYRGLYNIYLKSLGAATKRHPDTPIDAAIEYGERMPDSGYYFMDSPGNDLESVAGQVAAGCNLIYFVTGNGSITNFPFVPTLKIVTTTARYQQLSAEMDINAGAYLDGVPMDTLGAEALRLTCAVASGQRTTGENAGHAQVQIWRDWQFTQPPPDRSHLEPAPVYAGLPYPITPPDFTAPPVHIHATPHNGRYTHDNVALILPTSLCAGQIARLCVDQLNKAKIGEAFGISRFVTLVHTEGCGSSVTGEFQETLLGYLDHPFVRHALLLEHGCEATHNGYFRQALTARGHHPDAFGWASIQADGGIQAVTHKIKDWFLAQFNASPTPSPAETVGFGALSLAIMTQDAADTHTARTLAQLIRLIVASGGTVILPQGDALLSSLALPVDTPPTLGFATQPVHNGLHVMAMPTRDWAERLTGLGAAGVHLMLAGVSQHPMPGHPMIPLLQITDTDAPAAHYPNNLDLILPPDAPIDALLTLLIKTLNHENTAQALQTGNVYFQITRGLTGISL